MTQNALALATILARFASARNRGRIQALEQVWSPDNTLADTRYRVRLVDGQSQVLLQREVLGFLAGLGV